MITIDLGGREWIISASPSGLRMNVLLKTRLPALSRRAARQEFDATSIPHIVLMGADVLGCLCPATSRFIARYNLLSYQAMQTETGQEWSPRPPGLAHSLSVPLTRRLTHLPKANRRQIQDTRSRPVFHPHTRLGCSLLMGSQPTVRTPFSRTFIMEVAT
jgi:hypothetical protein